MGMGPKSLRRTYEVAREWARSGKILHSHTVRGPERPKPAGLNATCMVAGRESCSLDLAPKGFSRANV